MCVNIYIYMYLYIHIHKRARARAHTHTHTQGHDVVLKLVALSSGVCVSLVLGLMRVAVAQGGTGDLAPSESGLPPSECLKLLV